MLKKYPSADLKLTYPLIIESGTIIALLIFIAVVNVKLPETPPVTVNYVESDETALVLPPSVSETTPTITPPPTPIIPVKIPNDKPIEPPPIEINEFDQTSRLMIPPLPDEIIVEVNYDLLKGIEQLPELIGGEDAFRNSISYPEYARRAGVEGIVEVEFLVDEQGRVHDPVIVRGIGAGCDKAVLNAIKIQRYKPGKKGGKAASFKIKETVQFILLDT